MSFAIGDMVDYYGPVYFSDRADLKKIFTGEIVDVSTVHGNYTVLATRVYNVEGWHVWKGKRYRVIRPDRLRHVHPLDQLAGAAE